MSQRTDALTLAQMARAASKIVQRTRDVTYEQFAADDMRQDSVIRQLEIIGEAAGRLTPGFREGHPEILPWRTMKAMRNLLIHQYDDVDLMSVWVVAREDIPRLCAHVAA